MGDYVAEAGDIVWLQFDPQAGHEEAGHRSALVLSPARYNAKRGMMICCPMSSRIKGYVFEVVVSRTPPRRPDRPTQESGLACAGRQFQGRRLT